MSRIPYTFARNSIAAVINPLAESRLVQAGIPIVGYPGVRGGGGFLIMPAVTQIFYDNYFSNQTVDQAVGAPWSAVNTTVRDENTLIGGYSVELLGEQGGDAYCVETKTLATAEHTLSAFIYIPPPAHLDHIKFSADGVEVAPDAIISLGGYCYFAYYAWTSSGASTGHGIRYDKEGNGSIWVDCLSLTQTAAPVGFVPNAQTDATQASADDNLKFTLSEPLPQSGAISFVYIPFYDNDGSAVDDYPTTLSFVPSGAHSGGNDYLQICSADSASSGIMVYCKVAGGSALHTAGSGYAATGFKAFQPVEFVVDWDFAAGGTKLVRLWANGELQVESAALTDGLPTNLVDMWVGSLKSGSSAWVNHAQGIVQDIQIHRR